MNYATRSSCQVVFTGLCLFSFVSAASAGTTFFVSFDGTSNAMLKPPFVGSGVVSFDNVLGDGTYLLSGLTNLEMSFTIAADTWTYADIVGPSPSLSLTIYDAGTNFYFNGPPSSPYGGAADFKNATGDLLTTQPNFFGSPPFNLYFDVPASGQISSGTYGVAASTPEPASMVLFGMGALGLLCHASLRRKNAT